MPSISDVADQVNAKLDQVVGNTANTVTVCNGIRDDLSIMNSRINILDGHLQSGFSELSRGLFAIWELQKVTNSILELHAKQNDTIICLLENSNELLCGITRKLTIQLELSGQLVRSMKRVEGIMERAEPEAAGDFNRHAQLQCQILECCPPREPEPEKCPPTCPVSRPEIYKPKGQDWKPKPEPELTSRRS